MSAPTLSSPMIDCARSIALKLLAAAGRRPALVGGDVIATWVRDAFGAVSEPSSTRRPAPINEALRSVENGDVRVAAAVSLALVVWTEVDEAMDAAADPGTDEARHEIDQAWRETTGAAVVSRIDRLLAEALPTLIGPLVAG